MFDNSHILALARLPESCLKFRVHIDNLINFYKFLREQWTQAAINDFKHEHNLDLRKPLDRARMGWLAAQEWVACLPPAPEPIYFDELRRNYLTLVDKWHPNRNFSPEAGERFQLISAESVGKIYQSQIKGNFPCIRLTSEASQHFLAAYLQAEKQVLVEVSA